MRRSRYGLVAVTAVALVFGALVVTQFRAQEVFTRTLTAESASSLTQLIATISDRNSALRDEILELRLRVESAQGQSATSEATLKELRDQLGTLRVATALTRVQGGGVEVRVEGAFEERDRIDRVISDLVNELRNAGAEALALNGVRVAPRTWFGRAQDGVLVDGQLVTAPYRIQSIGATETISVALTRTGGIIGQLRLIYPRARFFVDRQTRIELPAARAAEFVIAKPAR